MTVALDFIHWIEQAPVTGVIAFPHARAQAAITAKAAEIRLPVGRVTLWLWRDGGKKMAFAMARVGGDGGERVARVVRAAPPFNDADKAQIVCDGERN